MSRPLNGFPPDARGPIYAFGPYRLDAAQRLLFCEGQLVPLAGKAVDILLVLVEARGRLVEKDLLMRAVWPDTFVEDSNLTFNIYVLRKALNDPTDRPAYIENLPRRGYRFLADVREVDVPGAEEAAAEASPAEAPAAADRQAARATPERRRAAVVGLVAGLLLVSAGAGVRFARGDFFSSARALSVVPFTSYPGEVGTPSFSPDGERLAFAWTGMPGKGTWDIYVKTIGQEPALQLTRDAGEDKCPTWSPDGRQIAFLREKDRTTGIYIVNALGGAERKLIDVNYGRYFDLEWSPDGKLLAFAEKTSPGVPYDVFTSTALFVLAVETLEKRQLTFPMGDTSDHRFSFSPDGKTLAFLRHGVGGDGGVGIFLLSIEGGQPRLIHIEPAWTGQLAWDANGRSLIFTSQRSGGNKLFRVGAAGGTPEPLPVAEDWAFSPTISRRGQRLAYVREYIDTDLWRVELEAPHGPGKSPVPFPSSARVEAGPAFSPDGARVAFLSDRSGKTELWLSDRDGGAVSPLTDFHAWSTASPSWSPDGRRLAFYSSYGIRDSPAGLFILDVESRQVRRFAGDSTFHHPHWSPSGRWIYAGGGRTGNNEIWRFPADGGSPIQITRRGGSIAQESVDGNDVYFLKTATDGIWRVPAGGGDETLVLAEFPAHMYGNWRLVADGLYYIDARTKPFASIEFLEFATGRRHRIALLTGQPLIWSGGLTVSPDRKWIIYPQVSRSASEIILVENFR